MSRNTSPHGTRAPSASCVEPPFDRRRATAAGGGGLADHRDDGLREVRAASRGERIPPVPVENEEQVPGRRVPVEAAEAQAVDRV